MIPASSKESSSPSARPSLDMYVVTIKLRICSLMISIASVPVLQIQRSSVTLRFTRHIGNATLAFSASVQLRMLFCDLVDGFFRQMKV
jgi:hypothetical protein